MRVIISGASGLIGSAVAGFLQATGHEIVCLVRQSNRQGIFWDPKTDQIDRSALERADAVIHLAGENIAQGRWTDAKKARIRESRVCGTALLCNAIQQLEHPPKTLICASAIGIYGNRGEEGLDEDSSSGSGFLAEVCLAWEEATQSLLPDKTRVVNLRLGMVLDPNGGALAQMLSPFKFGLGGVLGNGAQYMSWITIDDVVRSIQYILDHENIRGPVNLVSPRPVTNREFTKTLAKVLRRPALFPVPVFVLRLFFGEMADALLLLSARVTPKRLLESGYVFQYPELSSALHHLLDLKPKN